MRLAFPDCLPEAPATEDAMRHFQSPARSGALLLALAVPFLLPRFAAQADDGLNLPPVPPKSPREELATFRLPKGLHAELVAAEPAVVDPVAMAFDEEGRLFVAEMRGYPNDGVGTGHIDSGKIKLLEDRDGDGFYETSTTFAEGLRFPTSMMPWKGGLLVAVAPDIVYFEDTDGDRKADRQRVLYTGFGLSNIQQLINSLQWGLDNWVYGCAGSNGGTVRSAEKPDALEHTLRNRGVRFHPEKPGSLEPTSGGGQFGLAADDWQHWFTNTNSQHLRQIVLPDHYLQRNPALAVSEVTLDIPDHGAACKVFRVSPFEAWRVERTRRRSTGPDAKRFPSTELVPGGYITSACSPLVYRAGLLPAEYRGNTFICDPANNLIHRDRLEPHGATFAAVRTEADHEFLSSTDNWFRPVNLTIGPDGAIYVVDFYREVIETPLSLPDDIKARLNLQSRGRGRIWRIVPDGFRPTKKPSLRRAQAQELVASLAEDNAWWRLTAQRLLVERQDRSGIPALRKLATGSETPQGRAHALWTLRGLDSLPSELIEAALKDHDPGVREQGLRLAEERFRQSEEITGAAVALVNDADAQVRFQLALSLGEAEGPRVVEALAALALKDGQDPWTETAVLSSAGRCAAALWDRLAKDQAFLARSTPEHLRFVHRLGTVLGVKATDRELLDVLSTVSVGGETPRPWQAALVEGLVQGLQDGRRPLSRLWERPSPEQVRALENLRPYFARATLLARDERAAVGRRVGAIRLLGYGPFAEVSGPLQQLLAPRQPAAIQLAAVRALSLQPDSRVADMLLTSWGSYSPAVRREVLEALFARTDRLPALLKAMAENKVPPGQLEPFRLTQLRNLPDPKLRKQAHDLLAGLGTPDRQKVLESYRPALDLTGDVARGKAVFKKTCATCHRLENEGVEVGANLMAALPNKTKDALLIDILDPSREVDPRFINYVVTDKSGRVFTGVIAAETASNLTLRRAEKAEDTILRSQIDDVQATAKSLMPENLESQLSKQDLADVIAYLQTVGGRK